MSESQEISGGGGGVFGELGEESQTQETIDDDMVEVVEMDMEGNRKRQSVDMEGNRKRVRVLAQEGSREEEVSGQVSQNYGSIQSTKTLLGGRHELL